MGLIVAALAPSVAFASHTVTVEVSASAPKLVRDSSGQLGQEYTFTAAGTASQSCLWRWYTGSGVNVDPSTVETFGYPSDGGTGTTSKLTYKTTLGPGTRYTWAARATCDAGAFHYAYSDTERVTVTAPPVEKLCATVTFLRGAVKVLSGSKERPLEVGGTVYGGQEIIVPVSAAGGPVAHVVLGDGSFLRLGPGSRLRCDEADYEPEIKSWSFRLRVLAGQIWAQVVRAAGGGKFEIETDNGCACVRGTTLTVDARKRFTRVQVYKGKRGVEFFNTCGTKKTAIVKPGYESVIRGCNPPVTPRRFTPPSHPWWETGP